MRQKRIGGQRIVVSTIFAFVYFYSASVVNASNDTTYMYETVTCYNYTEIGVPVSELRSMTFTFDGSCELWIRLGESTAPYVYDYVVVITGVDHNNHSIGLYPDRLMSNVTKVQNSFSSATSYWISWGNGLITVGYGSIVGSNSFIVFRDRQLSWQSTPAISGIDVCYFDNATWNLFYPVKDNSTSGTTKSKTNTATTASPLVVPPSGRSFVTSNSSGYFNDTGASISRFDWVTFAVRSCCSVHIALTSGGFQSGQSGYEIVLGEAGNMVSHISDVLWNLAFDNQYNTSNILSCYSSNWFWISWTPDGLVTVGTGRVRDVDIFMVYRTRYGWPSYPISSLGISTYPCSEGSWIIPWIYFPTSTSEQQTTTTFATTPQTTVYTGSKVTLTKTTNSSGNTPVTLSTKTEGARTQTTTASVVSKLNTTKVVTATVTATNPQTKVTSASVTATNNRASNVTATTRQTTLIETTFKSTIMNQTALSNVTAVGVTANNYTTTKSLNSNTTNTPTTILAAPSASQSANAFGWISNPNATSGMLTAKLENATIGTNSIDVNSNGGNSSGVTTNSTSSEHLTADDFNSSLAETSSTAYMYIPPLTPSGNGSLIQAPNSSIPPGSSMTTSGQSASWSASSLVASAAPTNIRSTNSQLNILTQPSNKAQGATVSHEIHLTPNDLTRRCQPPPPAENAQLAMHNNLTYGQVAVYTCLPGHFFVFGGRSRSVICINGSWHTTVKGCQPVPCNYLSEQIGQTVSLTLNQMAISRCSSGQRVQNGNTTGTAKCSASHTGSTGILSKTFYQSCSVSLCPAIPEVTHAYIMYGNWPNALIVVCYPGYSLSSGSKAQYLMCSVDGIWTIPEPCRVVVCDALPWLPSVDLSTNATVYGTIVNASCQLGLGRASGTDWTIVQCLDSGTWNDTIQPCYKLSCPEYTRPNGTEVVGLITPPYIFGTTILYSCADGRRFENGYWYKYIFCQSNGQWTAMEYTCEYNRCPPVPQMTFGESNTSLALNGTVVTYTCPLGFAQPLRSLVCNGIDWDADQKMTSCQVFSCPELPSVAHGSCSSDVVGAGLIPVCILTCDSGYLVDGKKTMNLTCTENQQWTPRVTSCDPVDCGPPPTIDGASVLPYASTVYPSSVTYSCDSGLFFRRETFTQVLQCSFDATWQTIPKQGCTEIQCPNLLWQIVSSESVGVSAVVNITCPSGQMLANGEDRMTAACDRYGRWSPEVPDCVDRVKPVSRRSVGMLPKILAIPSSLIEVRECPQPHLVYLPALIVVATFCCLSLGFDLYSPCKKKCQARSSVQNPTTTENEAK